MADPRLTQDYTEIEAQYTTFTADGSTIVYDATKADGSAQVGLAVTLSGHGTVALCVDGDQVAGKLALVEFDGKCSVQVEGYCTLPGGTGATLTEGLKFVGALGASAAKGYIRVVAVGGATYAQAAADDAAKGTGQIIDNTDATNVVVRLC